MTGHNDRSAEALIARRAIAAQATPGPWRMDSAPCFVPFAYTVRYKAGNVAGLNAREDAAHIAANDPTTVLADINEMLRLRDENKQLKVELVGAIEVMECLLAGKPGGVYFQKYQGGLQIALRSAQLALLGAARKTVETPCPKN